MRTLLSAVFLVAALPLRAGLGPEIVMPAPPPLPAMPWANEYTTPTVPKPAAAALGSGFVAAWWDGFSERIEVIGDDGKRTTDYGVSVAESRADGGVFYRPVAASRGDTAAVAYATLYGLDGSATWVRIVHPDGTIDPATAAPPGLPFLASDGDGYLLVFVTQLGTSGVFLDASGHATGSPFLIAHTASEFTAVASNGSTAIVMTRTYSRVDAWLVTRGGGVSQAASFAAFEPTDLAAAWDGEQYVLAWNESATAHGAALDGNGSVRIPPRVIAPGAARSIVSSGDGTTLVTQPPQFVRFARGTLVPIARGDLDLDDVGAAAQNGDALLVEGAARLNAVVTNIATNESVPTVIAFAQLSPYGPQVATGDSLSVVSWSDPTDLRGAVARLARFTPSGILDMIAVPNVPMRIDASGYRVAIATIENDAIALRALDSQGNVWPPEILAAPSTVPSRRALGAVVITPDGTAVIWRETTWPAVGVASTSLYVTFERGPTIDLGTIDGDPIDGTWDGTSVVVATSVQGQVVVTAVTPEGVRWTLPLNLNRASFQIALASNHNGRTIVARSADAALIDGNGKRLRNITLATQTNGSAAFDGSAFVVAGLNSVLRISTDGNAISRTDLPDIDYWSLTVGPGAIAYTRNSRLYVRCMAP